MSFLRATVVTVELLAMVVACLLTLATCSAETVPVRYQEGEVHGFLELQTLAGENIAYGETTQTIRGNHVIARLVFRFSNGSQFDEVTEYSQDRIFRLIRDHVVQKGPAFKEQLDATIDLSRGEVTVSSREKNGREKTKTERLRIPDDASNGLLFTILKNIRDDTATTVSWVAATPKPRIIKMRITPEGRDSFSVGTLLKEAKHYVVKIEIGGIAGFIAPFVGKQPADINSWVIAGDAPSVVRTEAPLEANGAVWRIQMAQPVFANQSAPLRPKSKSKNANGRRH